MRLAISPRDLRLLFQQSGNHCAFPGCTQRLTCPATDADQPVALSEVAHIVASSPDGPRGNHPLPHDERDRYDNLILLCERHHTEIDTQVATYPVERLRQMKFDHESLIAESTRRAVHARAGDQPVVPNETETLYSSLLPVERLPKFVFSMECSETEAEAKRRLLSSQRGEAAVFVIRGGRLYCFHDLRNEPGPFYELAKGLAVERDDATELWADADRRLWYVTLLNRTLNKITGWRHLNLDRDHHRYFFDMLEQGQGRTVQYRPMNQSKSTVNVVWQPITKKTGLPKNFWYHKAVALSFLQTGVRSWCLALRPEMRVTKDGKTPVVARRIGGKVTKKKARMFNLDVLEELNFWRDYLFDGGARIAVTFGSKGMLAVSANFLSSNVTWPGVPPERAKTFKNAVVEQNLFEMAMLEQDAENDEDDELDVEDDFLEE
ncbi:MAG: HNH endonuclease signature motif containing protein [Planctomycetota bacterium]|nr:HNH endonuclease signature motif containing protein [Planctomycetota bacterium]